MREPKVFLMDEPPSDPDAKLRVETWAMISRLHHYLETTFIYAPHRPATAYHQTRSGLWRGHEVQSRANLAVQGESFRSNPTTLG